MAWTPIKRPVRVFLAAAFLAACDVRGAESGASTLPAAKAAFNSVVGEIYQNLREGRLVKAEELRRAVDAVLVHTVDPAEQYNLALFYLNFTEQLGIERNVAELKTFRDSSNPEIREHVARKLRAAKQLERPVQLAFTAIDGRPVDLAALRGKVVLLQFWATWCRPCIAEMPHLHKLYDEYRAKGFEIVGVACDAASAGDVKPGSKATPKTPEQIRAFIQEKDMPWPHYFVGTASGGGQTVADQFAVKGLPVLMLFDRTGMIVALNTDAARLEGEIKRLLQL